MKMKFSVNSVKAVTSQKMTLQHFAHEKTKRKKKKDSDVEKRKGEIQMTAAAKPEKKKFITCEIELIALYTSSTLFLGFCTYLQNLMQPQSVSRGPSQYPSMLNQHKLSLPCTLSLGANTATSDFMYCKC